MRAILVGRVCSQRIFIGVLSLLHTYWQVLPGKCWGGFTQPGDTFAFFPSPISNATGKLRKLSPIGNTLSAESTSSFVRAFCQEVGAP